jgi:hypothetical protein
LPFKHERKGVLEDDRVQVKMNGLVVIYGYFPEKYLRDSEQNKYIDRMRLDMTVSNELAEDTYLTSKARSLIDWQQSHQCGH